MIDNIQNGLKVVKVRLVRDNTLKRNRQIKSSDDAVAIIKDEIKDSDREMFCILNLGADGTVINMNVVSIGSLTSSMASPREVFKSSILSNASAVILFHNHPSGNCNPSMEDRITTKRLRDCGQLLDIPVLDHIIVGGGTGKSYSLAAHDELDGSFIPTKEVDLER